MRPFILNEMTRRNKKNQKKKAAAVVAAIKAMPLGGSGAYRPRVRGQGGFWSEVAKDLSSLGGGVVGSLSGQGWDRGRAAGKDFSRTIGWGRMRNVRGQGAFSSPSLGQPWNSTAGGDIVTNGVSPIMGNSGEFSVRMSHSEYVGDLLSTVGFDNTTWSIQPGLDLFPWLRSIASNFSMYRIHAMTVELRSMISRGLASYGSLGLVAGAVQPDPAAAVCTSVGEILSLPMAASGNGSDTIVIPVECSPREGAGQKKFIRTGPVPPSGNLQNYDAGTLQIATYGAPSAGVATHMVIVNYDVELFQPKLVSGGVAVYAHYRGLAYSDAPGTILGTIADPVKQVDNIGITWNRSTDTITIPANLGKPFFDMACTYKGSGSVTFAVTWTVVNAVLGGITWDGFSSFTPLSAGAVYTHFRSYSITDPTKPVTITLSSVTLPTTAASFTWNFVGYDYPTYHLTAPARTGAAEGAASSAASSIIVDQESDDEKIVVLSSRGFMGRRMHP